MRLVKDESPGAFAVRVQCIHPEHARINAARRYPRPGRWFTLAEGYSDLDGEPFVAYYCDDCIRDGALLREEK